MQLYTISPEIINLLPAIIIFNNERVNVHILCSLYNFYIKRLPDDVGSFEDLNELLSKYGRVISSILVNI